MTNTTIEKKIDDVKSFWNNRADLGIYAGTRDITLKKLEIEAIAKYVKDGMRVLDAGCGNGITAVELARRFDIKILGLDYAEEMVNAARRLADNAKDIKGSIRFEIGDVRDLSNIDEKFDLIYTERTLINLPDWETQKRAIENIGKLLDTGGLYVMCEHSQDGLNSINTMRKALGLEVITPPWHNRYFKEFEIRSTSIPGLKHEGVVDFSSTYYFLSRIVNAHQAALEGREPDYDAPINEVALEQPSMGDFGQGKIWLWRKR